MALNYYDRAGRPMTREQWSASLDDTLVRNSDLTVEGDVVSVSTIWLGLDHQWNDGPPLIFETMVFGGQFDEEMVRHSTEEEAVAGHAAMCTKVQAP